MQQESWLIEGEAQKNNMGSMNSNKWLSFPLSPFHSSLPTNLQPNAQSIHPYFSLGLLNDNTEIPFQNHDWSMMNTHSHSGNQVPKVADFLGVSKAENNQSDLAAFNNDIQPNNDSEYLFTNNNMAAMPTTVVATSSNNYEYQEHGVGNSHLQSLTLSMGSGSGSGKDSACEASGSGGDNNSIANTIEVAPRRTSDTFGQRTSIYRGVTRHRWTGRYEAHLWDNSCRREGQSRKGRQVYLGGYDKEEKAARAYDLAALKYWGTSTTTNFPITNYEKELEEMKHVTRQEFVAAIRRKSSGFSRGASMYRGVTRHHQHGRWQARIGRVAGNKDLYLGTFSREEDAAEAYDIAAIKFRGLNAVTNFDMNRYDVKAILESSSLPIGGGAAKRLKEAQSLECCRKREEMVALGSAAFPYGSSLTLMHPLQFDQQSQQDPINISQYSHQHQHYPFSFQHQREAGSNYNMHQHIQGLTNLGGSSSSSSTSSCVMDNATGGFMGMGIFGGAGMPLNSTTADMASGGFSAVEECNAGVFSMWSE